MKKKRFANGMDTFEYNVLLAKALGENDCVVINAYNLDTKDKTIGKTEDNTRDGI